ncbi:MAG: hemolysin family protein [Aggregatilineales bacterium]
MSDDASAGIAIVAALIIFDAIITLAYAALANVRVAWLKEQVEQGNRGASATISIIETSTRLTVTYQFVSVLLSFTIAVTALSAIAQPIINANAEMNATLIRIIAMLISVFITVILGDIVPEAVGSGYAKPLAVLLTPLMRLVLLITSPFVIGILWISQTISGLLGSGDLVNTVTEEEIMTLIETGHSGGTIEDEEKAMIYSVLQLDQTRASEVMVPRIDVVAVDIEKTLEAAGTIFIDSGYSRIPVYADHIDQIRGILYAKDLLIYYHRSDKSKTKTISDLMRKPYFISETTPADELLKELQTKKVHMAVVVDEYGGTAGIVTIENIIEEIIGDIQDEYDLNEEADYVETGTDEYDMDASIDLDHFNDLLDVGLPTEDMDTLGGYIYTHFGRVPRMGELIETDELTIEVLIVDGRRIRKVHVTRKRPDDGTEDTPLSNADVSTEELKDSTEAYD